MSESEVQRCAVADAPSGWPALHVLRVAHLRSVDLAAGRDAARQRVRDLLLRHAGPEIAAPVLAAARAAAGASCASISHEHSHSLLAWCAQGSIGIDSVSLLRLADMSLPALVATATLYLGPKAAAVIGLSMSTVQARSRFADAWARHEASLKCLGLALDEWSPAVQAQLAGCSTAVVLPPAPALPDQACTALAVMRIAWCRRPRAPLR